MKFIAFAFLFSGSMVWGNVNTVDWKCMATGRCFHVVQQQFTWYQAQAYCRNLGQADLATVQNAEENDFLVNLAPAQARGSLGVMWIGLFNIYAESKNYGVWSDGSTSTYRNWAPAQPDDACNKAEHCGEIDLSAPYSNTKIGGWNDLPCDTSAQAQPCLSTVTTFYTACELLEEISTTISTTEAPSTTTATTTAVETTNTPTTTAVETTITTTTTTAAVTTTTPTTTAAVTTTTTVVTTTSTTFIKTSTTARPLTSCDDLQCSTLPNGDYGVQCADYFFMCSNGYCYKFQCPIDVFGQPLIYSSVEDKCLERAAVAGC